MTSSNTFLGQWTLPGDNPPRVWISRHQILIQDLVTEQEMRTHPDIDWDPLADSYWVKRDSAIWTWLQLKGLVDETKFFPPEVIDSLKR
jgi:hypothetical protein